MSAYLLECADCGLRWPERGDEADDSVAVGCPECLRTPPRYPTGIIRRVRAAREEERAQEPEPLVREDEAEAFGYLVGRHEGDDRWLDALRDMTERVTSGVCHATRGDMGEEWTYCPICGLHVTAHREPEPHEYDGRAATPPAPTVAGAGERDSSWTWKGTPSITAEDDRRRHGDMRWQIVEKWVLRALRFPESCPGSLPVTKAILDEIDTPHGHRSGRDAGAGDRSRERPPPCPAHGIDNS